MLGQIFGLLRLCWVRFLVCFNCVGSDCWVVGCFICVEPESRLIDRIDCVGSMAWARLLSTLWGGDYFGV